MAAKVREVIVLLQIYLIFRVRYTVLPALRNRNKCVNNIGGQKWRAHFIIITLTLND